MEVRLYCSHFYLLILQIKPFGTQRARSHGMAWCAVYKRSNLRQEPFMALAWGKCARGEKWKEGRGTSKCQGTGKIVRYNRGTLRVTCVTSVSVWFRNKERGTKVKDCAKNGAIKRAERGWGRKEGKLLPLLLPSLSFFGSRFISRVAKTENPVPSLSLLRNQRHSMTFGRFVRLIIRDPFLERSKNFSGQRQILESKPVE